ncbi:MAG: hypothetical protein M0Z45_10630 [Actinomycetota bacterium]|nr:hypothetical protein [Actinomycetota bacterium]
MTKKIVLLGSGETAPTMVKVHRSIFAELDPLHGAVMLDTPFGFQANAEEIAAKAAEYFRVSIGEKIDVASLKNYETASAFEIESFKEKISSSKYIFAGPGSPTYALRQWAKVDLSSLLAAKLSSDFAIVFSSAAVLTLGRYTIPVYEIYKVGEDPQLRDGLNFLASIGLDVLVIPHYNNQEGGSHDTRYCYMGEERLPILESQMEPTTSIIGIDEHTGVIIDLEAKSVTIVGIGTVTLRRKGRSSIHVSGEVFTIDKFKSLLQETQSSDVPELDISITSEVADVVIQDPTTSPLRKALIDLAEEFEVGFNQKNASKALDTILKIEDELEQWRADTLQSDDLTYGRSLLRSCIAKLGQWLEVGSVDRSSIIAPFVETLLDLRSSFRDERRFSDADLVRDRLIGAGIEVKDHPTGSSWTVLNH